MSIATLARKSRAQRGASTRTGWTLATTKSGNCPNPCGGGAPAKQQSFRRLMKNKARPGVEQEAHKAPCCTRTQRVEGSWTDIGLLPPLLGDVYAQNQGSLTAPVWVLGTLLKAGDTYGIFEMSDCDSEFNTVALISSPADYDEQNASILDVASVSPPVDTYAGCGCCPPVATWKKTNDPKGEQSIGYYLWRKKQLTHNCIKHCIPHREHYNEHQIYVRVAGHMPSPGGGHPAPPVDLKNLSGTYTYGVGGNPAEVAGAAWWGRAWSQGKWQLQGVISLHSGQWLMSVWYQRTTPGVPDLLHPAFFAVPAASPVAHAPPESGWTAWTAAGITSPSMSLSYGHLGKPCPHAACDNVGCKCNCNKSMGGTACCVVHKTMLPLSNSENIAWVVEDRTCLQTSKPAPRNPNTC